MTNAIIKELFEQAADLDYQFAVYGEGEITADYLGINVEEALDHVEGQDEAHVYFYNVQGVGIGYAYIINEFEGLEAIVDSDSSLFVATFCNQQEG